MYARYVPPAASSPAPAAQPASVPVPREPHPEPAQPTLAQPTRYSRYIPPTNPSQPPPTQTAKAHVRFDQEDQTLPDEPPPKKPRLAEGGEPKEGKKSKKSKKSKKRRTLEDSPEPSGSSPADHGPDTKDLPPSAPSGAGPVTATEVESSAQGTETGTPVKERREKKKKKEKSKNTSNENGPDETPHRHKAVLERAAKFMQRPEPPKPEIQDHEAQDDGGDVHMQDASDAPDASEYPPEPLELHGLEPLPQPKPVPVNQVKPTYETLPPWLAEPIRVSPQDTAPFTSFGMSPDLGISQESAQRLAAKGYKDAFAVQTAVIPQLLPNHCKSMQGDLLVSAATGSGKTLAYALPMIRDLSRGDRRLTRLQALIVLPTRELVRQAQEVCEQCATVFAEDGAHKRVRIGISMGSQTLTKEQPALVERSERYDPEAYARRLKRLDVLHEGDEDEGYNTDDEERAEVRRREDRVPTLPDHVLAYQSKVDILICTPGRLVEHVNYTPGFSLDHVRWLIVDEADKLLSQDFQQWLSIIIPRLQSDNVHGARNHMQSNLSGVRKVILSATMTRDLDRLSGLKLRRPRLIALQGFGPDSEGGDAGNHADHTLPELLDEAAIRISDPNLKPLFLVDLLRSPYILDDAHQAMGRDDDTSSEGTSSSDASSDDESDDTSDASSDDASSDSDSDSDSSDSSSGSKPTGAAGRKASAPAPPTAAALNLKPKVLIFTKSNETAMRLSRLLALLAPSLEPLLGTLTSMTPFSTRKATIRAFSSGRLRILVASDLVARGIDLPSLDHVVNYDMPTSVASYVHRVGRTARAGRLGRAWTMFTIPEARWFWTEVAGEGAGAGVQRRTEVQRVRVTEEKEDAFQAKVAAYEAALEALGQEAAGEKTRRGR